MGLCLLLLLLWLKPPWWVWVGFAIDFLYLWD